MKKAIGLAVLSFLVLLYVGCRMSSGLASAQSHIATEAKASNWTSVVKKQRVAVACIDVIGRDWCWHALVFSGFSVAGILAHSATKNPVTRGVLTIFVLFVMLLGTAVFVATEQLSGILTVEQRMESFQAAFQVKIGSVVIALFAGRTFFEMFKNYLK